MKKIRDSEACSTASVSTRLVLLKFTRLEAGPHLLREADAILLLPPSSPLPSTLPIPRFSRSRPTAPTNKVSHGQRCGGGVWSRT